MTALLLPLLAVELKLPKEWSYSSLYLTILETAVGVLDAYPFSHTLSERNLVLQRGT